MQHHFRTAAAAALVAAAVLGCSRNETASAPSNAASAPASSTAPAPQPAPAAAAGASSAASGQNVSDVDRNFMMQAAQGGMLEVEASKLAAERAESASVKQFAQMLVDDHSGANAKLKELAQTKSVTLPAELNAEGKASIDKLAALRGAEFDRAYAQTIGTEDHRKDIALFEKAAQDGQDSDVKAFASNTLPTLREHLSQAEKLAKETMAAAK